MCVWFFTIGRSVVLTAFVAHCRAGPSQQGPRARAQCDQGTRGGVGQSPGRIRPWNWKAISALMSRYSFRVSVYTSLSSSNTSSFVFSCLLTSVRLLYPPHSLPPSRPSSVHFRPTLGAITLPTPHCKCFLVISIGSLSVTFLWFS